MINYCTVIPTIIKIIVINALSEIKVQKLSLGRYLFKRYMFVLKVYIFEPNKYKSVPFERYRPSDSFCTFISESVGNTLV